MNQRQLNQRAKAELETLQESGIELTWSDVVEINHLAWMIESPSGSLLSARGEPVRIPGAILWPMTLQAHDWWLDHDEWFNGIDEQTKALGYLLAHGRRACLRARLATRPVARRAVFSWVRRLPCTVEELTIGVGTILEQGQGVEDEIPQDAKAEELQDDDGGKLSTGQLVAFLVANTGLPGDYWERKVSAAFIGEQVQTIVRQGNCDDKPAKDDPRIVAERNLGYALMQIEDREQ